jgi:uncharacterized protein YndB with AHSA1/START domain
MVVVSRSVHIAAPVERVFGFITDPAARSQLHPEARPIRVEVEGGGPLRANARTHFRLQLGHRIVDYHTQVREFVPNRRIVSVSDSAVPFQITLETIPENHGTRLTQTEEFEPTDEMLVQTLPRSLLRRIFGILEPVLPLFDADYAQRIRGEQEELLARQLEPKLQRWLEAIRQRLETGA